MVTRGLSTIPYVDPLCIIVLVAWIGGYIRYLQTLAKLARAPID